MYSRGFNDLHPFSLLLYYFLIFTGLMLFQHPVYLFVSLIFLIGHNMMVDRGQRWSQWIKPTFIFALILFLVNPIFNRRGTHLLFYFYGKPVLLESLIMGAMIALSLIAVVALFASMNQILTVGKISYLISKFTYQWRILIVLSMRFIPRLRKQLEEMLAIQELKFSQEKDLSLRQRLEHGMKLVSMLLTASLEGSIQTADSMTSRGYGQGEESFYEYYYIKVKDKVLIFLMVIIFIALIYLTFQSYTRLTLYPSLENWQWGWGHSLGLLLWSGLLAVPLIMEGVEKIKWHSYQSKI